MSSAVCRLDGKAPRATSLAQRGANWSCSKWEYHYHTPRGKDAAPRIFLAFPKIQNARDLIWLNSLLECAMHKLVQYAKVAGQAKKKHKPNPQERP